MLKGTSGLRGGGSSPESITRSAWGGQTARSATRSEDHFLGNPDSSKERLFTSRLPFGNSRYRHFDLACKFLLLTDVSDRAGTERIPDLKKAYLDDFVVRYREDKLDQRAQTLLKEIKKTVDAMTKLFVASDWLLRQVGMVTLYFTLLRDYWDVLEKGEITRRRLEEFHKAREANREFAERDEPHA